MRPAAAHPGSRRSYEHASGGFTLLELLVAMTLLGLLMTALFGGLRLGTRVWEASERVLDQESRSLAIRGFLRDRLEQAIPARIRQEDGNGQIVFAGDRTKLRFASTMPDSLGIGPFIIELSLRPRPSQGAVHDLALRWRAIDGGGQNTASGFGERPLVSDLTTISFTYFGTKTGGRAAPAWHSTWRDQEALPDLIRLDVGLDRDASPPWPPLIVSPKVNAWFETTS